MKHNHDEHHASALTHRIEIHHGTSLTWDFGGTGHQRAMIEGREMLGWCMNQ